MMCLMRTEVVVAKGKPVTPLEFEWIKSSKLNNVMQFDGHNNNPQAVIYISLAGFCSTSSQLFEIRLIDLLFILPEFLNSEDVEFVSVDVRQETVRLSDRLALRCASAVSHQIHTVTCTQDTDTDMLQKLYKK